MPLYDAGYSEPVYRPQRKPTQTKEQSRQDFIKQQQMLEFKKRQEEYTAKMGQQNNGLAASDYMDKYMADRNQRIQGAAYMNPQAIFDRLRR